MTPMEIERRVEENSEEIEKIHKTLYGNGEEGWLERVRALIKNVESLSEKLDKYIEEQHHVKDFVGPTYSEVKMILKILKQKYDTDALGNPKEYSADDHPGRRVEDKLTSWDKLVKDYIKPILIQLVVWSIIGFVAFQFALHDLIVLSK